MGLKLKTYTPQQTSFQHLQLGDDRIINGLINGGAMFYTQL